MRTAPGETVIETDRLILRNWRDGDAESFDRHCNNANVMRWLGGVQSRTVYDEVAARLTRWQEERGFTFWVVERKADAAFLGFCGIKIADGMDSSVTGCPEIGWRLREDAWGQGYAREAASAALAFAFGPLGAQKVVALTVNGNEASWGLMLRLGMTRRADLDYIDPRWPESMNPVIVYEMERDGWKG
ncbi:GNAT family N-acetyltransferase [Allosphingosinicella flava]|uniref:GNAT family N-acetyltransferase n=1 Tax=Allosphingosinicella flava TaxID=2771430 RepID=A0A7T2LMB7_9SPHN|nr:GNAT family protein [Sphingosinicella flava]QPQ55376.1 GNAT family N-acetyltransferase [Sphingosinicella flava]